VAAKTIPSEIGSSRRNPSSREDHSLGDWAIPGDRSWGRLGTSHAL